MKTVARSRSGIFSALFVVGGLAALYFYRRQGGQIKPLIARGTDLVKAARERIEAVAPEAGIPVSSRTRANEIPMAPEDMDRFPAT